jgi:hypothetical protein
MDGKTAREPHPTDAQLAHMAYLINDYNGRKVGEIMRDVWAFVAQEIASAKRTENRSKAQRKAARTRAEVKRIEEWKAKNI